MQHGIAPVAAHAHASVSARVAGALPLAAVTEGVGMEVRLSRTWDKLGLLVGFGW